MEMNSQNIPKSFEIITHLASVFLLSVLLALFGLLVPQTFPSAAEIAFGIIRVGFFVFLFYALAGGLEWKNEKLPMIRSVLFWVLSLGVYGLILWGFWILVRKIMAKIYKIPYDGAKGRLLNKNPSTKPPLSTGGQSGVQELIEENKLAVTLLIIIAVLLVGTVIASYAYAGSG